MEFFTKALEISDKIVTKEKFVKAIIQQGGWSEKNASGMGRAIFETLLPWIVNVLHNVCNRVRRTPEEDAKYIYLYVALFNCMKRLIQLYCSSKTLHETKPIFQAIGVAALSLTFKAMEPDENGDECFAMSEFSELEAFCNGNCPKELLLKIETEMFKLSDYTPCMDEYKEMSYVIRQAKLRVE